MNIVARNKRYEGQTGLGIRCVSGFTFVLFWCSFGMVYL